VLLIVYLNVLDFSFRIKTTTFYFTSKVELVQHHITRGATGVESGSKDRLKRRQMSRNLELCCSMSDLRKVGQGETEDLFALPSQPEAK
jgi:hypothetical protein